MALRVLSKMPTPLNFILIMSSNKIFNKKTIIWAIALKAAASIIFLSIAFAVNNANATYGVSENIKQAKTADSPVVYYLDHKRGLKKAYINEKSFLAYGNKWSDVKIVKRAELDRWPEVRLVKTADSPKVYYINNGKKAWIQSVEQFNGAGFSWSEVVVIIQPDLDSYQAVAYDQLKIVSSGGQTDTATENSELKVELDSASPSQTYIPTGSRGNTVAAFKFSASGGDAEINKITLTRIGVMSDDNINAVYLEDEAGVMYGYKVNSVSKQTYINFGEEPVKISADQTKTLLVKVDLRAFSAAVGQTLGFSVSASTDIDSSAQIAGDFPIKAAEHKLIDGTANLGRIKVSSVTLNSSVKTVKIGAEREEIASFRFEEASGNEDVLLKKIIIINTSSAWDSDFKNIRLIDEGGKETAKAESAFGKKVTFNLSGGYKLKKNHSVDFTIKADIVGGDGRDIKFVVKNSDDVSAVGAESNYGLIVESDGSFPVRSSCFDCDKISISHAPVFITAASLKSDEKKIYRDQDNAALGVFELRNGSSDIKIDSFDVSVTTSSAAPALNDVVYLVKYDSGEQISSIDDEKISNQTDRIRLSNYQVSAKDKFKFALTTHIPDSAASGATYQVQIKDINYYIGNDNRLYTDILEEAGQTMQVVEPSLYLYGGEFSGKDSFVAGDTKVKIAVFKIEAASDEKIKIIDITIFNAAGFTPATYANGFSNLALYKGSFKIGSPIAQPTASSFTFSNLKISVPAGKSIDLYVKADLSTSASGEVELALENVSATGYSSGAPVIVNNKGAKSPSAAITKTELNISAISGGAVTAGAKNNKIASFAFANQASETIKLDKATVTVAGDGLSKNNGFFNLRFGYESNGKIKQVGSKISSPVGGSNEISLGGYKLAAGESVTLNLYVDAAADVDAAAITLYLQNIKAKGYLSGVEITDGVTDSVSVIVSGDSASGGGSVTIEWPTSSHNISYYFHDSDYPYADEFEHSGIDIKVSQGTEVESAAGGRVTAVYDGGENDASYVMIEHNNGLTTVYGHLSKINVSYNDTVTDDTVIGLSGGRPGTRGAGRYSTGEHLHFEVRANGTAVDPMGYLE